MNSAFSNSLKRDGLGAYYPRPAARYRDGSPVDLSVKGLGDIPACCGLGRLGETQLTGQTIALSATQIAGAGVTAIAAGGSAAAPALLGLTAAAVPIIGAVVAGVTVAISLLWNAFNHDPRKNATTSIVNQIEPHLQTNLSGYLAGPRTLSSQAQALANFDAAWNLVVQNCDQAQFGVNAGDPGYNCIHDRMAGACHWTVDGHTPGTPPNNCGNWYVWYRDPIANDPNVVPDPGSSAAVASGLDQSAAAGSSSSGGSSISSLFSGSNNYLVIAGLLAGAALIMGSD